MRSVAVLAVGLLALACAHARAAGADWATVVAAGDDRAAHSDRPTLAFDNARRDVAGALVAAGAAAPDLAQLSLRPAQSAGAAAGPTSVPLVLDRLSALAARHPAGCLLYVTSHGSPDGLIVGDRLVPPPILAALVTRACGERPTAVILSACFSGQFVPALAGPRRFVMTAARADRSSFGCGEGDRYPFFDGCVIAALPLSGGFADLAVRVRRCVSSREDALGLSPHSEPQVYQGAAFPDPQFLRVNAPRSP
ncbi:MAG: peptidase C13 [Caulobacteraceae bacterium]|nr:peptidase C13 [Caulobacteraceae bacterium]